MSFLLRVSLLFLPRSYNHLPNLSILISIIFAIRLAAKFCSGWLLLTNLQRGVKQ